MVNFHSFTNALLQNRSKTTNRKHDEYQHVSAIFTGNIRKSINVLSVGINELRIGKFSSIHAEMKAGLKLRYTRIPKRVNVFVGRTGENNMSKPCHHCLDALNFLSSKGYRVHQVYYTGHEGLVKILFRDLMKDPNKHVSKFFRNMMSSGLEDEQEEEEEPRLE